MEDSVAAVWLCPVAVVTVVTAVTPRPAGAPSPPFPTDPLTELLQKYEFPSEDSLMRRDA